MAYSAQFENYAQFSSFTPATGGISTGIPHIDLALGMFMGGGLGMRPDAGAQRSVYDAYTYRQRSMEFQRLMAQGALNHPAVQMLGGTNPDNTWAQMATQMAFQNPDGLINRLASPFVGGNPVAAQMGLYAGMTGMTNSVFGRTGNVGVQTTQDMMKELTRQFFNQQDVAGELLPKLRNERDTVAGNIKTAGTDGALTKALQSRLEEIEKDITDAEKLLENGVTKVYQGINYKNTRGFKQEDFTRGFRSAADYQLIDARGADITDTFSAFAKNADLFDAARSTFGTSDMSELMDELNAFIGKDFVNLAEAGSSQDAAKLLRDVRAAARSAGVSIDAILEISKETQMLASQHPQLSHVGGIAAAQITLTSINQAQAMATQMTSEQIRREGGMPAMVARQRDIQLQNQMEPVTRQLAALSYAFNDNEDVTAAIARYTSGESGFAHNALGFQSFMGQVSELAGVSSHEISNIARNDLFARKGLENNPFLAELAGSMLMTEFENEIERSHGTAAVERARELAAKPGASFANITRQLVSERQISNATVNRFSPYEDQLSYQFMMQNNPAYQARLASLQLDQASYSAIDAEMAEQFAHLNAPILENFVQMGISGGARTKGVAALRDYFSQPEFDGSDAQKRMMAVIGHTTGLLGGHGTAETMFGGLSTLYSSVQEVRANAAATPEEAEKIRAQTVYFSEGRLAAMSGIAKQMGANALLEITEEEFETRKQEKDSKFADLAWEDVAAAQETAKAWVGLTGEGDLAKKIRVSRLDSGLDANALARDAYDVAGYSARITQVSERRKALSTKYTAMLEEDRYSDVADTIRSDYYDAETGVFNVEKLRTTMDTFDNRTDFDADDYKQQEDIAAFARGYVGRSDSIAHLSYTEEMQQETSTAMNEMLGKVEEQLGALVAGVMGLTTSIRDASGGGN